MNKKDIRILFFGTPSISANVLEKLINNNYSICGVIAQEDKINKRGNKIEEVPTKVIAKKYNIPVFQFSKVREHFEEIKNINPDLILVLSYGQIISHDILELPKFGCLNLHGSLLPKYRGASPIQYALLNGDKVTGITLMQMIDKMDAGAIYAKEEVKIDEDDNYDLLLKKLTDCAFICFDKNFEKYINNELIPVEQDENLVSYTRKITDEDEKINFNDNSFNIVNKIRALSLKPGCYFIYKDQKIKILKAKINDLNDGNPGKILQYDKNGFIINTLDKSISIEEIQKPGKNIMKFKDFYNGNQTFFNKNETIK